MLTKERKIKIKIFLFFFTLNCDNFDDNSNADNPSGDDDSLDAVVVEAVERQHMDLPDFEGNNN